MRYLVIVGSTGQHHGDDAYGPFEKPRAVDAAFTAVTEENGAGERTLTVDSDADITVYGLTDRSGLPNTFTGREVFSEGIPNPHQRASCGVR